MLTRTEERTGHNAAIYALRAAPDGFYSAAADGYIVHWHREDVNLGRVVAQVEGGKFLSLDTLPEGGLVAGALDGGVHWLYPGEEERNLHIAHHRRGVFAVLRVGDEVFTAGGDGVLTRWNAKTGRTIESLPLSVNSLRCIAYSTALDYLAIGASDGNIYLLERGSLRLLATAEAHAPSVFTLDFAENGYVLYSGGRDAKINSWKVAAGELEQLADLPAHLATVNALARQPGGVHLVTASRDKTIKLWNGEQMTLLKVCEVVRDRGHVNSVNTLLWLDEKTVITAGDDRRILTWALTGE